ncbi:MAG TPA: hypothetical protein VLE95_02455 [Chlamydiales bacterium]|nr:hypothetical protein [Chlamydiales bacterium]
MISDSELLFLNRQGFIPGPQETEEMFLKRIDSVKSAFEQGSKMPKHHWEWVRVHLKEVFDFEPHCLPVFYSNSGLALWQGAAVWIEEGRITSMQLKAALKKGAYLGYSRDEILAHESVHAARSAFDEPKSEEFFAFLVSEKWWRRAFGPIVRRSWEVWAFLTFAVASLFSIWGQLAVACWVGAGFFRLMHCHWRMRNAAKHLHRAVKDVRCARAILMRLTDAEIRLFSRGEPFFSYADQQTCLRWRLIRLAYIKDDDGKKNYSG